MTGSRPPARCLIPAAGRGTRLRPITRIVPKALLPIGTRPMLQWCLTEALEGGFEELAVVAGPDQPLLDRYVREGEWRSGLLPELADRARALDVELVRQEAPAGVVDAVLAARDWVEEGRGFAVFLPDNVRIAGPPPIAAAHVAEAEAEGVVIAACHRVGPEARSRYGDVGRAELEPLVPAGSRPRVLALQARGEGTFQAAPEGAWRLAPRYTVTAPWLEAAHAVRAEASLAAVEADDVEIHRRLVADKLLLAAPWSGTLVDAGHPRGYLWAQHLLHEASEGEPHDGMPEQGGGRVEIEGVRGKA